MNVIYLLIGGNMGDKINNLDTAINFLQQEIGNIIQRSSVYETAAWGNINQPDFVNQVLVAETSLDAAQCMQFIFSIENKMGRIRSKKNDPRIIDIDILFFNDEVINEPGLIIPHPEIQNRKFVLIPLNELSPNLIHPVLNQTVNNLLSTCGDRLEVRLLKDV